MLLDKIHLRNFKLLIAFAFGLAYNIYFTVLVWTHFDEYYEVNQNLTSVLETITRIGDRTYVVLFPICNFLILLNVIIFLIRVADFNTKTSPVCKMLEEFKSEENLKASLDSGMLTIETQVSELCEMNNILQSDFSTSTLLLVGALFVLIMNTLGLVIIKYFQLDGLVLFGYFLQFSYPFAALVTMTEAGQESDEEKRRIEEILSRLCLETTHFDDKTHMLSLKEVRYNLTNQSFSIIASDLFCVKRKLILAIVGACVTYCIVIYQDVY